MEPSQGQLRPIMDMARESWARFTKRVGYFIAFMIVSAIVPLAAVFAGVMIGAGVGAVAGSVAGATVGFIIGGIFLVAGYIAAFYFSVMFNLAFMAAIADEQLRSIKEAVMRVKGRVGQGFLTSLLVGVIIAVGMLVLIIPGIYLAVIYAFALWVFLQEQKSGMDALRGSQELVRGRWWPVFGRLVGFGVLLFLVVMVPQIVFSAIGLDIVGVLYNIVASVLAGPVTAIYIYLLFLNLKSVKVMAPQTGMKM